MIIIAPRKSPPLSMLILMAALFLNSAILGIGKEESPNLKASPLIDLYLQQLRVDGLQIEIVEQGMNKQEFASWRRFLTPTFHVDLRFDGAQRIVFKDRGTGRLFALFSFQTPTAFRQTIASFNELTISGSLQCEAPNDYYAVANSYVFAILLTEKTFEPDTLTKDLSKSILAHGEQMARMTRGKPVP